MAQFNITRRLTGVPTAADSGQSTRQDARRRLPKPYTRKNGRAQSITVLTLVSPFY